MSIQENFIEQRLISLMHNNSEDAFIQVYDSYWESLFNHAYNRIHNREIVQELVQDLFVELWQKRKRLTIHTSLSAYLHQSLKYKILNHVKAEIVRQKYADKVQKQRIIYTNEVENALLFKELDKALKKEIAHLPPQPKMVYQLKHEEGLNYREISETLKISVSTVEKHMIKALKTIRENLKEYAIGCLLLLIH